MCCCPALTREGCTCSSWLHEPYYPKLVLFVDRAISVVNFFSDFNIPFGCKFLVAGRSSEQTVSFRRFTESDEDFLCILEAWVDGVAPQPTCTSRGTPLPLLSSRSQLRCDADEPDSYACVLMDIIRGAHLT